MFKHKPLFVLLALLTVAFLVAGCGGQSAENGGEQTAASDVIKIGFLGDLTGDTASYGKNTLEGMKMAAEELNADGVLGKQIKIVEADHRYDKAEAANIVQKFINEDKVSAIVGDPTTGITKATAPISNQGEVVQISAGSTGPEVVEIGPYIFRNTLLDAVGGPATMDYAINELGWKNVALITSVNNDFSVGLSKIFKDAILANGGNIVIEESVQDGDTDFSGQVSNIKGKNPDFIVFSGYYTEGGLIMKEVRKQGMNDIVMVGGDGLQSPTFWELGGQAVEGSISYCGFSPEQPTDETAKFIEDFKAKYSKDPDLFHAQGYDAVKIIAAAMEKAQSADPKVFRDAMAQTKDFPGVSGITTFRENREPIKSPVYLLQVKDQKWSLLKKVPVDMD
ncbi:amino acid/amide ABC transporter substrate-binding protein, HAAT family (TC 3.A.1.4.-) [Desulfotomaculum arcticum]|uniref:Amino acid/amide ABC transporter substrate-binding protein, HAAT family (TC 3.A.1.4.-) n=1 Tax=Desulfotruncus arcticus DSM 17038 TaxID=1121424 RepID=A0A1I2RWR9_9FIRM|nr:ABC transporter substrate-binding protein [Desulfotruncus arcticus]SFG45125.1 amino acid/amide ABC transporter substrate-binding protein, HAAT family (TC 3.A.1.4.-) [Desulfotomaculum arcticum] [Desulfotruncus arcticus DSM 17038]